jgi:putative glycosyltransferase
MQPQLSIVTTFYRGAAYIGEFCTRMLAAARKLTDSFELVIVNDGSPDNGADLVRGFIAQGQPIRLVDFSRNFGHHKALIAGLEHARGDLIFLIDSDLEEQPELLEQFWQEIHQHPDVDVVYGVQRERKGGFFEKNVYGLYYNIFNALSPVHIPKNMVTARIMRRDYVNKVCSYREHDLNFFGVCAMVGYVQKPIFVDKGFRGETTYNLPRKIALAVDTIACFSSKPLEMVFFVGCMAIIISLLYSAWIIYRRVVLHYGVEGWSSIIVSVWLLGGLILCSLGVIGFYISKIYVQVKERPRSIVKAVIDSAPAQPPETVQRDTVSTNLD